MHGVGGEPVQKAFKVFNLPELIPVAEQMQPDPEFPTVLFPNPEEGKSALVRFKSRNYINKGGKELLIHDYSLRLLVAFRENLKAVLQGKV